MSVILGIFEFLQFLQCFDHLFASLSSEFFYVCQYETQKTAQGEKRRQQQDWGGIRMSYPRWTKETDTARGERLPVWSVLCEVGTGKGAQGYSFGIGTSALAHDPRLPG